MNDRKWSMRDRRTPELGHNREGSRGTVEASVFERSSSSDALSSTSGWLGRKQCCSYMPRASGEEEAVDVPDSSDITKRDLNRLDKIWSDWCGRWVRLSGAHYPIRVRDSPRVQGFPAQNRRSNGFGSKPQRSNKIWLWFSSSYNLIPGEHKCRARKSSYFEWTVVSKDPWRGKHARKFRIAWPFHERRSKICQERKRLANVSDAKWTISQE